jgi:hypothetical protein
MKLRASDSRSLGKVSMAWRSCSLRGIGFAPTGAFFYFRRLHLRKTLAIAPFSERKVGRSPLQMLHDCVERSRLRKKHLQSHGLVHEKQENRVLFRAMIGLDEQREDEVQGN